MDQWLDSLSEDWVSQPRSQHSSSVLKESPGVQSNGSLSRIPRYMSGTASRPSLSGEKQDRPSSRLSSSGQKDVLKARTQSELNKLNKRTPDEQVKSASPALGTKQRKKKQQNSPRSEPLTTRGTVQHKVSPTKDQNVKATPEWKKRIVKGEGGKGSQTDLFSPSPVGLEGVFKPPTIGPRSPQKNGGKKKILQGKHDTSSLPQRSTEDRGLSKSHNENPTMAPPEPEINANGAQHRHSSLTPHGETKKCERSMDLSTSDQSKSDNFSSVYVSKQNTADGRVDYTAVDKSMRRLRSNMDQLRLQQQRRSSSRFSDRHMDYSDGSVPESSVIPKGIDEITSQSLPDDLSVGTDAFAANGGFISITRGGHSNEGSFCRKPLSPSSSLVDLNGPILKPVTPREKSVSTQQPALSKQQEASPPPQTPPKTQKGTQSSPERPRSSGSPLKLFDKYDTFTNDRLARRMSKFEETFGLKADESSSTDNGERPTSPSPGPKAPQSQRSWVPSDEYRYESRISSFGEGDLDKYAFPSPYAREPTLPQLPRLAPEQIHAEASKRSQLKKRKSFRSTCSADKSYNADGYVSVGIQSESRLDKILIHQDRSIAQTRNQSKDRDTVHGKRLPFSPAKDPARKRRRTIHSSEERRVAEHGPDQEDVEVQETPSKSLLGRKRKDALYDNVQQAADPWVIAMRQIRRPRNPTPNQASSATKKTPIRAANSVSDALDRIVEDAGEKVDPPTQIVAGALATVALNAVQDITFESRKASVTTADFFSEAQQIMRLIRAEKRPRSSHSTADASEVEPQIIYEESAIADSTRDEFSRPPSREGGSLRKLRALTPLDARVVSHLRKFEDKDDLELAVSSSLKSLKVSHQRPASDASIVHNDETANSGGHESDPPNIRILERMLAGEYRDQHAPLEGGESGQEDARIKSQGSSGQSTRRSIPTGSSGSSGNKMVIAPETVAHLLSDQMAGMVFDRQKQMWIKRKGSINTDGIDTHGDPPSDASEEDLFGDIPDLSVDEMEELKRVQEVVSAGNTSSSASDQLSHRDFAPQQRYHAQPQSSDKAPEDARPKTAEGKSICHVEDSSAPSKYSHYASSGPVSSTRATSWGDDYLPQKLQTMQAPTLPAVEENTHQDENEEVEHEISILEDRVAENPNHKGDKHRQARVVTVAFSSPLVDHMQSPGSREDWDDDSQVRLCDTPSRYTARIPTSKRRASVGFGRKSVNGDVSRRMSVGTRSYIARPMSRVDEYEEMSMVQYSVKANHTMDVAISTPLPLSRSVLAPPTAGQRSSVGFQLSPLPDFTVHQIDRPVDAKPGTLVKVSNQRCLSKANDQLSLTAQNLVSHLTDLEPYEPYWECIRSVDLHDRGLTSLHMLDNFCSQAEELDVSNNQIGELNGIPSTVRLLNIRANCLSDLAAWHHLQHLQYLDVSGNDLTSLKGLYGLVHLRALRADDNVIEGLDGIEDLNGLLSLRLRNNRLRIVDFVYYDLRRLTNLDMQSNSLLRVCSIERLPSLKTLNLGDNDLEAFTPEARLDHLETLNMADNNLSLMNVHYMPALHTLILDRNAIQQISNLEDLSNLNNLSWRSQRCTPPLQHHSIHEIYNLYLSSNTFPTFSPATPYLNLQTLELASASLQTLPPDLGLKCPNLRILNLNYNALRDLRPLLGIAKLQRLYLAGNRISRLRRTAAVLARLGGTLREVEFRNNPLTVGFYTPVHDQHQQRRDEKQIVAQKGNGDSWTPSNGEEDFIIQSAQAYLLTPPDKEADSAARETLDEETKLRRRVYEMLFVKGCKHLERLDGLEVRREEVGRRDGVLERLLELGVLKNREVG